MQQSIFPIEYLLLLPFFLVQESLKTIPVDEHLVGMLTEEFYKQDCFQNHKDIYHYFLHNPAELEIVPSHYSLFPSLDFEQS